MVKKILYWAWGMRYQFIKYFVVGVTSFVLDVGSLYLLKEYLHWTPVAAVIVNQIFILNFVFAMNKYWSFKATGMTKKQIIKFYTVAGFNYLFAIIWMWVVNDHFGVNYLITRIANIILAVSWNFLLYRYFVFVVPVNNNPIKAPDSAVL